MAVITDKLGPLATRLRGVRPLELVTAVILAAVVWYTARQGLWTVALVAVVAVELWQVARLRAGERPLGLSLLERAPMVLFGASVALIIAASPRGVTQIGVALGYVVWRLWVRRVESGSGLELLSLLLVQAAVFEALFLVAAVWRSPSWLILALVWVMSYVLVYAVLARRGERAAGVIAATWALVVSEAAWVFLIWLVSYVIGGGLIIVPQPALVLTGLAYCFGSIYVSQRGGSLSRGRLTEYLLIALIMIAIVITGTPWRGTL